MSAAPETVINNAVALETTVLSHGLPFPANLELARALDDLVTQAGAEPHTVGILDGRIDTCCSAEEIERFCKEDGIEKVSLRNLPAVVARGKTGATTVAATMRLAHQAGIRVMATGGIGGVHQGAERQPLWDESADLTELARCPMTLVCAGPKAILHLEATRERLESLGVTLVGWQTDVMPAFYCGETSFPVDVRCDTVEEIASIVRSRDTLGLPQAILVTVPLPEAWALPFDDVQDVVSGALASDEARHLKPAEVTPFLLDQVRRRLGERALTANVELLKRNAELAARIAVALSGS